MKTYEKHVHEFILGQGYVAQKPVIMSEEEVRAELEAQGGQKYQNVWYVEVPPNTACTGRLELVRVFDESEVEEVSLGEYSIKSSRQ